MTDLPPFIASFDTLVERSENMLSIARGRELQEQACSELTDALTAIAAEKQRAIKAADENYANMLLGCECVARALMAEIRMWMLLKTEEPDAAWDQLVAAQMASVDAVRAHAVFTHLQRHVQRLEAIERLVFPPQVFISSGFVVNSQECSVCGSEYEECDHLLGKPYMGKFCYITARDLEIDHVSIVNYPADKRCRVQRFGDEGGQRNRMTWRIEPNERDT